MSLFTIFQISSQGMTAQRERLEVASSNLANAHTTRTAEGGAYRRRDVVLETVSLQDSQNQAGGIAPFAEAFGSDVTTQNAGVRASIQMAAVNPASKRFQPGHPDADADGYVQLPEVDPLEETVNMLSAARSFEANATVFNTAKELARATLRLGETS
jgi:flagellar basal-body rod protein FlgC